MTRAVLLRVASATIVAALVLALAALVVGVDGPHRASPPRDEVRIERILDFQLPVL